MHSGSPDIRPYTVPKKKKKASRRLLFFIQGLLVQWNARINAWWLHLQQYFLKWLLSAFLAYCMYIMCTIHWINFILYVPSPVGTANAFHLSQAWLASVLPFQRHVQAQWLDGWFVLLASERAGPISKWAEPHIIPSKRRAHDLIWKAEPQPARDVFR